MKKNKKLSRKIISLLPEAVRFSILRMNKKLDEEWPSSLEIKIAETEEEFEGAFKLLHDCYANSGTMNSNPTEMRVITQHLLPETTTIVAKWNSKVIGTLSLIRDNAIGLPLEKAFSVNERRLGGRRIAEVSFLTIDPEFRGLEEKVLFPLLRFVVQYARYYFGVHEFVIAVKPSMVDFYMGLMCFEKLKETPVDYDFVNGALAVGLFLNFETADQRWLDTFGDRPLKSNFYRYWATVPNHVQNKLPKRIYHSAADPVITPELLKNFFLDKTDIMRRLSKTDIKVLMDSYPYPAFQEIFKPLMGKFTRKNERFETDMVAIITEGQKRVEVFNVSLEGLMLRSKSQQFTKGHIFNLQVWLNDSITTNLIIEVSNVKDNNLYGLKIVEGTIEWHDMIHCLSSKSLVQLSSNEAA
jgi:hypothetical protein